MNIQTLRNSVSARGIMSVRADMSDPKKVLAELQTAWTEFQAKNDARLKAVETRQEDVVQNEEVDRINATITQLQANLTELATRAAGAGLAGGAGGNADDERFAQAFAMERGLEAVSVEDFRSYRNALNVYMRRGQGTPRDVMAAMSVGSDPDGGYTVTPDTSGRIIKRLYETSPMRQVASVDTIGTDRLEGFNDLGEAGAGWVGETEARPATTTPQLGKWEIPVHEVYAFPMVTQKLLDDSMWDIESWLTNKVSDKFARMENAAFLNGNGVGKPRGLLTFTTAATADSARAWGVFQHVLTGTDGGFGTTTNGSDKLIDLVYGLKAGYRQNANFMMSRASVAGVRKLKDGQGNYLWAPSLEVLRAGNLIGFPIVEAEDMPVIAADALSIAFGDFREAYQIVDRIGVRVLRDPFTNKPYVGFYTTKRVGGAPINFEAVKFLKFGD
ncbi:HK97 family phage major capsid protein [Rhodoligotrophos appendicifer]|uniref:phage major capsid protein n=1 Tax=Rhodoligotrophos appendicifer TaxID=987056 RepID=UPI001185D1E4|nr:phage major capsid protein [Rhodoligotrophos appendicifer]